MPRPGQMMGRPKPKLENPMGIFKRILGYVFRSYLVHCIIVFICIVAGVLCNLQGTNMMFKCLIGCLIVVCLFVYLLSLVDFFCLTSGNSQILDQNTKSFVFVQENDKMTVLYAVLF